MTCVRVVVRIWNAALCFSRHLFCSILVTRLRSVWVVDDHFPTQLSYPNNALKQSILSNYTVCSRRLQTLPLMKEDEERAFWWALTCFIVIGRLCQRQTHKHTRTRTRTHTSQQCFQSAVSLGQWLLIIRQVELNWIRSYELVSLFSPGVVWSNLGRSLRTWLAASGLETTENNVFFLVFQFQAALHCAILPSFSINVLNTWIHIGKNEIHHLKFETCYVSMKNLI